MTEVRLSIPWNPIVAAYAADVVEEARPELAARLRGGTWVTMGLEDARAIERATHQPSAPDYVEREPAWLAAICAEDELEREQQRLAHLDHIRAIGIRAWMDQLDEICPDAVAAWVLGMDEPDVGTPDELQIRARARELGLPVDRWQVTAPSPSSAHG